MVHTKQVAVIGAGAAGTLVAIRLLEAAQRPLDVIVIDPAENAGRGIAYATEQSAHLLNVPAGRLSVVPSDPGHFANWADAEPGEFLPRGLFGRYLADMLAAAAARSRARLRRVRGRVVGLSRERGIELRLESGGTVLADAAVLALGVFPPDCSWAPAGLRDSPRFVADPWAPRGLDGIADDEDVLLVGTGLTMADMVLALDRPHRKLTAVSRHGLLPRQHLTSPVSPVAPPELTGRGGLDTVHREVVQHIRTCLRNGHGWRSAVDGLRPLTTALWRQLPHADRERFLTTHLRHWEVYRHRMPPVVADRLREARRARRLRVLAGEILDAVADDNGVTVTLSDNRIVRVGAVVNCVGPQKRASAIEDPLVTNLLDTDVAAPGPHGFGFDTDEDGRLAGHPLWTLGALRIGNLWETTAIPEIRDQAGLIATKVISWLDRPHRNIRPADRYGLPLSTTVEAADVFNEGLDRVLLGQDGAIERMATATEADPGFALGHAALALLSHEWGAPQDCGTRLRAALDAVAVHGDARERMFVDAVAERVTAPCADGAALRHYIDEYPRDALAISVAVPTIAFGGLTHGRESWALIERLGTVFGNDWWYRGQLAFVRQEQGRFAEAEQLATAALGEQPASTHAVHAKTHVCYETGEHRAGLAWLDDWIRRWAGQATGRAHFAWHAALHELVMGDGDAVCRRYATQIGPTVTAGQRLLVDSGSLIWRCAVTRQWDIGNADDLLDTVLPEWLSRPSTAFLALHAAVTLAAADDLDGLARLGRYAAGHTSATYRQAIEPLCTGLAAALAHRWTEAISALGSARPAVENVGGSLAQQEVVEETLLYALISAGRDAEAAGLLSARLDRRPSPLDHLRLRNLSLCAH